MDLDDTSPRNSFLNTAIIDLPIDGIVKWRKGAGSNPRINQLSTVADLIRFFFWTFDMHSEDTDGFGKISLKQFKVLARNHSLNVADWPLLAKDKDEWFKVLPKEKILEIPLSLIPPFLAAQWESHEFLGIPPDSKAEDDAGKAFDGMTVSDLLKREVTGKSEFVRRFRGSLLHLWQNLAGAGFSETDGAFMAWDQENESYEKALKIVKDKLPGADQYDEEILKNVALLLVGQRYVI